MSGRLFNSTGAHGRMQDKLRPDAAPRPRLFMRPIPRQQELFELFLAATRSARNGSVALKIYRNGKRLAEEPPHYLPMQSDRTLCEYARRLRLRSSCKEFLLYIVSVDRFLHPLALRAKSIVQKYLSEARYKYERLEMELFFGWYCHTPGGIHSEACANFHFVVFGRKLMEIWPPDTFNPKPFSQRMQRGEFYLGGRPQIHSGCLLAGANGEAIVWPSRYWHVGHSPLPSGGINLALYGLKAIDAHD